MGNVCNTENSESDHSMKNGALLASRQRPFAENQADEARFVTPIKLGTKKLAVSDIQQSQILNPFVSPD